MTSVKKVIIRNSTIGARTSKECLKIIFSDGTSKLLVKRNHPMVSKVYRVWYTESRGVFN